MNKVTSTQKVTVIDMIVNDDDTVRALNAFFSNIISDLKFPDYNNCDALAENIQEFLLKAIVKYRNHPSILTLREVCKRNSQFYFRCVEKIKF